MYILEVCMLCTIACSCQGVVPGINSYDSRSILWGCVCTLYLRVCTPVDVDNAEQLAFNDHVCPDMVSERVTNSNVGSADRELGSAYAVDS